MPPKHQAKGGKPLESTFEKQESDDEIPTSSDAVVPDRKVPKRSLGGNKTPKNSSQATPEENASASSGRPVRSRTIRRFSPSPVPAKKIGRLSTPSLSKSQSRLSTPIIPIDEPSVRKVLFVDLGKHIREATKNIISEEPKVLKGKVSPSLQEFYEMTPALNYTSAPRSPSSAPRSPPKKSLPVQSAQPRSSTRKPVPSQRFPALNLPSNSTSSSPSSSSTPKITKEVTIVSPATDTKGDSTKRIRAKSVFVSAKTPEAKEEVVTTPKNKRGRSVAPIPLQTDDESASAIVEEPTSVSRTRRSSARIAHSETEKEVKERTPSVKSRKSSGTTKKDESETSETTNSEVKPTENVESSSSTIEKNKEKKTRKTPLRQKKSVVEEAKVEEPAENVEGISNSNTERSVEAEEEKSETSETIPELPTPKAKSRRSRLSTSKPNNPNSALAIRERLGISGSGEQPRVRERRSLVKKVAEEVAKKGNKDKKGRASASEVVALVVPDARQEDEEIKNIEEEQVKEVEQLKEEKEQDVKAEILMEVVKVQEQPETVQTGISQEVSARAEEIDEIEVPVNIESTEAIPSPSLGIGEKDEEEGDLKMENVPGVEEVSAKIPEKTIEEVEETKLEENEATEMVLLKAQSTSPSKSPTKSSPPKKLEAVQAPTRSSTRKSKPNRLYSDEFDLEPVVKKGLGPKKSRTSVSPVKSGSETPNSSSVAGSSGKLRIKFKMGGVEIATKIYSPDDEPEKLVEPKIPKTPEVKKGMLIGYVPSIKPIFDDIVVNGKTEKLGFILNVIMNDVMLEVCKDGVKHYLDQGNLKSRRIDEQAIEKRRLAEAKKLEIMMTPSYSSAASAVSSPTTVEEVGGSSRRRRHVPTKQDDEYYYVPTRKLKEGSSEKDEERSEQSRASEFEMKAQRARDSLLKEMKDDMERAMIEETHRERSSSDPRRPKKKKAQSLHEYMRERDIKNRPECGIKLYDDEPSTSTNDIFYHEMLTDYPKENEVDVNIEMDSDPEIDIGHPSELTSSEILEEHKNLLLKCHGDSISAADQIEKLMSRPVKFDGAEYTLDDVVSKAAEQSVQRLRNLHNALGIVKSQYLLESTPNSSNHNAEAVLYNITNTHAQQLRDAYTMYDIAQQDIVCWVHKFLIEFLPVNFLTSYLVLLKYAKPMTSSYIGLIVKSTIETDHPWKEVTEIIVQHVSVKASDPEMDFLNQTIGVRSMSDSIFLMISPAMSIGESILKPRYQDTIFRWMKSVGHPESEIIRVKDEEDDKSTVAEVVVYSLIDVACDIISQKNRDFPDARIILVGYNWSTYVAHQVVQKANGVSAIISLGFPVETQFGRRGTADDDILLTYCPTLFVVGAEGDSFNNISMKDLRSSMMCHTGLVVVGHATDQLLVPLSVLNRLGVTQKVVFRLIFEKILQFLSLEETKAEKIRLFPPELNNILSLDSTLVKNEKVQPHLAISPAASLIPASAPSPLASTRRITVGCVEDAPRAAAQPIGRKRVEHPPQSPLPSPSGIEGARQKFQEAMLLKKCQIPDDLPRRTISVDGPRPVERGDFRERVLATPAGLVKNPSASTAQLSQMSSPSVSSKGPIDPASISLS